MRDISITTALQPALMYFALSGLAVVPRVYLRVSMQALKGRNIIGVGEAPLYLG